MDEIVQKRIVRGSFYNMYKNFSISIILSLLIIFMISGCDSKMNNKNLSEGVNVNSMKNNDMKLLMTKKMVFGHASVGANIVEGIDEIKTTANRMSGLHIKLITTPEEIKGPGFYHFKNGNNGQPKNKIDSFRYFLEKEDTGNKIDVAILKLCYVDFNQDTNVEEIFNYYVENIGYLKKEFPNLKIMHVTVPLYAHAWGLKGFIKNLLHGDISNIKRNQYNEMLMNRYKNTDPVFDLAGIESINPSGKIESFNYHGKNYVVLAKENTDDGGHLNKRGRDVVASELLKVLAGI